MLKVKNVLDQQISDIINREKPDDIDLIFKILSLLLYANTNNDDIKELYKIIDVDSFVKIINLFDGRTVKFPYREQMKDMLTLSLAYFFKEVENKSWEEIKAIFPYEINSIGLGLQINRLSNFIKQRINEIIKQAKDI